MVETKLEELLNQNLVIVQRLEKKASMFSNGMLVLSLLDVIFGILAIFCASLQVTALFMSVSSLTAITTCGRVIQLSKIRQFEKSLKTLNLISLAWFVNRYKKYLKEKEIKMTKSTVLQKILTTILSVFGVGGVVVFFIPQFNGIATSVTNIVAMLSEIIAVVSGIWLSQTSDKVLTAEEIAEAEKTKNAKKLKKAEAIVSQYEEAQKLIAESKNKQ